MRILVIKDKTISAGEMNRLQNDFTEWVRVYAQITPTWRFLDWDYSDYPTYSDSDGDQRPTHDYLMSLADESHKRFRDTVDHVFVLVHEDNWKSDPPGPSNGIWGTNYSFIFRNYQLHYCRFDRDNAANSFGTFWHEITHSFDAFVLKYTGINIVKKFPGMTQWDKDMTHGGCCDNKYIRWKDNAKAFTKIAPDLRKAYEERHKIADQEINLFIALLKQLVMLYRQLLNAKQIKKDGVPRK